MVKSRPHTPDFQVSRDHGKTCLTDKGVPVLHFDPEIVRFCACRLRPDGPEMFGRRQRDWYTGGWFVPFWGGCHFGRERAVTSFEMKAERDTADIRLISRSASGVLETDWRMTVAYDPELRSYVYLVDTAATVYREPDPATYNKNEFEYFDLFPTGLVDQATAPLVISKQTNAPVNLPGPRWDYLVYERDNDVYSPAHYSVIRAPLNRFITSAQNNIRLKRDGLIGFMDHPDGNPMIQLLGDTAAVSRMDLCNWFYDLHLNHVLKFVEQPPKKGDRINARFRLMDYGGESARRLLGRAVLPAYHSAERAAKAFPRLEIDGSNSFENDVTIDRPDHSKIWRPFRGHPQDYDFGLTDVDAYNTPDCQCVWDRRTGHTGASSLHVRTLTDCAAGWGNHGFEALRAEPGRRYKLAVYVRTCNLRGRGASFGVYAGPYGDYFKAANARRKLEYLFCERWISGNADWQRLEIVTPPVPANLGEDQDGNIHQSCNLQIVFWHEGRGESWFDDLTVELI